MTRKCSLCAGEGHNMTTCNLLTLRQEQMNRLYLDMWQKWLQMFKMAYQDGDIGREYLKISIAIQMENAIWLKKPLHLRLLRSYLNISTAGSTDKELVDFIFELYRQLVSKKNNLRIPITSNVFDKYDYLLDTFHAYSRDYGIIVQQKTTLSTISLESCVICYEDYPANNFVKTNCQHSFCQNCVIETIQILPENKKLSCAMCRSNINHLSCYTSIITNNLKNVLNL